jgi:hypothetical protein
MVEIRMLMLNFDAVLNFSHGHCVAICAVLVPLNLFATARSLVLVGLGRPVAQVYQAACLAIALAGLLVLHVASWFIVGVIMLQTFVLLGLGTVCLASNLWAIEHPASLERLLKALLEWVRVFYQRVSQRVKVS